MIYTHEINDLKEIDEKNLDITASFAMIKRSYIRYLDNKIVDFDITSGEVPFLLVLNENDKITQNELSNSLRTSEGLVTRVLRSLEEKGYVTREVDKENKRRKIITITPKGKKTAEIIKRYQKEWENKTFGFLTDVEFDEFRLILKNGLIKSIMIEND